MAAVVDSAVVAVVDSVVVVASVVVAAVVDSTVVAVVDSVVVAAVVDSVAAVDSVVAAVVDSAVVAVDDTSLFCAPAHPVSITAAISAASRILFLISSPKNTPAFGTGV